MSQRGVGFQGADQHYLLAAGKLLEVLPGSPDVLSYHDSRKTHPFGLGYHFIGSQTAVGASPVGMDVEVEY